MFIISYITGMKLKLIFMSSAGVEKDLQGLSKLWRSNSLCSCAGWYQVYDFESSRLL